MARVAVNLIIKKEKENRLIRRLKVILPIVSVISLVLFAIIFFISIIYINANMAQYNLFKKEISLYEKKVSNQKNVEGIYTLTASRLNVVNEILSVSKNFYTLIEEINNLQPDGISIGQVSADGQGNVSFSLVSSSSSTLDNFITLLLSKEQKKLFSQMQAQGIVREKKGNYFMTVTLRANESLLK